MNEYDHMRNAIAKHLNCTWNQAQDIMLKIVRTPFWQVGAPTQEALLQWAERLHTKQSAVKL